MTLVALRAHRVDQAAERLRLGAAWTDSDLVFTTATGGISTALCRRAGVRSRVRVHDLRHTCASLLLAQGVEPRVIMETLGHWPIATTMNTYANVLPMLQGRAAERMQDLLAGAGSTR